MDKVYLERPNICEVLQEKIRKYKRQHPRFSGSQIARKWGLSTSSLNRIENGDIRNPTIIQSIKVLKGTSDNQEIVEFMRTYYPDIHESLFSYFTESSRESVSDKDIEDYFSNEETYKMMMLASSSCGLSENYILQEYGRSGHKKFMKLAAKGIVKNIDGRFYTKEKNYILSEKSSLKITEYITKRIYQNIDVFDKDQYRGFIHYESINFEKVKSQIEALMDDYKFEILKILKSPENQGEDLFTIVNLATCINQTEIK